jgi:hypothetical protein
MTAHLLNLTVEFLEDLPDGLRLVTQANSPVECLISSRTGLSRSLANEDSFKFLDVPGVYLLIGPPVPGADDTSQANSHLYIGQADSVADRLDSHLKSEYKRWWQTAVIVRRAEKNPLNLTQCKFLESMLCSLAVKATACDLANKVAPQLPSSMSRNEERSTEDFLQRALIIVSALGWGFFQQPPSQEKRNVPQGIEGEAPAPPEPPANLKPLLEEIHKACTGPSFPKAEWYSTRSPDYRAKSVGENNFRVFARARWTKNWLWLDLKDVGKYKVRTPADLNDEVRKAIEKAYKKAEQYLQQGR